MDTIPVTQPDADPPRPRRGLTYVPALDGIRAIAVLLVAVQHLLAFVTPQMGLPTGGYVGVDLFFVLSGFLITALLLDEYGRTTRVSYRSFYRRRAARLFPALALLLLVQVIAAAAAGQRMSDEVTALVGAATYTTNWLMAAGHALPANTGHLWSLAVEEQFYLAWPIVLVFAIRRWGVRVVPVLAGIGIAFAVVARAVVAERLGTYPVTYLHTETRIDALLIGALLAWARHVRVWTPGMLDRAVGWLGLAGLTFFVFQTTPAQPWLYYDGGYTLLAVVGVALVIGALDERWLPGRVLACRPLVELGRRSYGIYLWNLPMCFLVGPLVEDRRPIVQAAAVLVANVVVADLSYRFVEQPLRARFATRRQPTQVATVARSRARRRPIAIPALCCVGVLALGGAASAAVGKTGILRRDANLAAARPVLAKVVEPAALGTFPATTVVAPGATPQGPEVEGSVEPQATTPSGGEVAGTTPVPLVATTLVVEIPTAVVNGTTSGLRLSSRLVRTDTGAPLPGKQVTNGSTAGSCTATTDADGRAACTVPISTATAATASTAPASATFAGDSTTAPATASLA